VACKSVRSYICCRLIIFQSAIARRPLERMPWATLPLFKLRMMQRYNYKLLTPTHNGPLQIAFCLWTNSDNLKRKGLYARN
jgi:hypothetical protein